MSDVDANELLAECRDSVSLESLHIYEEFTALDVECMAGNLPEGYADAFVARVLGVDASTGLTHYLIDGSGTMSESESHGTLVIAMDAEQRIRELQVANAKLVELVKEIQP